MITGGGRVITRAVIRTMAAWGRSQDRLLPHLLPIQLFDALPMCDIVLRLQINCALSEESRVVKTLVPGGSTSLHSRMYILVGIIRKHAKVPITFVHLYVFSSEHILLPAPSYL